MGCLTCNHQGATDAGDECPTCHGTGNNPDGVQYMDGFRRTEAGHIVRLPPFRSDLYVRCSESAKRVTQGQRARDARQGFHGLHTCPKCGARVYWYRSMPKVDNWSHHMMPVDDMLSLFDPTTTGDTEHEPIDDTPAPF